MGLNMSKHAYLYGHVTRGGGGSRFVYVTGPYSTNPTNVQQGDTLTRG